MKPFENLNHFRGAFLTKTVIDRKQKITTAKDGTAELYGPQWPDVTFHLNHINHARYLDGKGPHLFQVTFGMVHKTAGFDALMEEPILVSSISVMVPPDPRSTPPVATIAMESGSQIVFSCGSISVAEKARQ